MSKTYTKRLGILVKREDMMHEQFVAHWMGQHATLCDPIISVETQMLWP